MAYVKTLLIDRAVQHPRDYTMVNNPDGTVTLTPAPGTVTEQGTPITAATMNNIEQGIFNNEALIGELTNEISKSTNGWWKDKKTGFMIQWCEVDANLTASQSVEVAVTMPLGFNSGGAMGWANCISNVLGARYITTNVTVVNSLLGSGIARVYASQPVNATMRLKIFMIGW